MRDNYSKEIMQPQFLGLPLLALLLSVPASTQASTHTLTLLNPFGSTNAMASVINDHGMVGGGAFTQDNAEHFGFLWSSGAFHTVVAPGVEYSDIQGLNNDGVAVGTVVLPGQDGANAYAWRDGTIKVYPSDVSASLGPGWEFRTIRDINAHGDITGTVGNWQPPWPEPQLAGYMSSGSSLVSYTLGLGTYATALNDHGDVVGFAASSGMYFHASAFRWSAGNPYPIELDSLGGNDSGANDINNNGLIVGLSTDLLGISRAVFWDDNGLSVLDTFAGAERSVANAVNESGLIVGGIEASAGHWVASMWQDGEVIDLNTLLSDEMRDAGWRLHQAHDVNESGWIVGEAFNSRTLVAAAFVLAPVPELDRALLMLAGLGVLALRRRSLSKSR